jgi:hypothetical protein
MKHARPTFNREQLESGGHTNLNRASHSDFNIGVGTGKLKSCWQVAPANAICGQQCNGRARVW